MRTGEIIAIVVLAIILLIAVSYIIIKYGIKYFKRNQTYGGGWFSRKPKTAVPAAINTGTAVPKKPGFFQRQKARWNDPNSMRRQMTSQLTNQTITTGALVATTAAMNAVAPGTAVDPNLILQQGMQQGMNVVQTGVQQGMQQGMNYVQDEMQQGMNYVQNGVQTGMNTLQNGVQTGIVQNWKLRQQAGSENELSEKSENLNGLSTVLLTGISTIMELFTNSQEIIFYAQNIPAQISGVIVHIVQICSNPISPIKEAYLNFDGIKVLIKTSIRAPIRNIQAILSKSLSPILTQGVEVIMVGYENLIYEDIILPILSVLSSIIRIVECIDVAQMVTPELKQFYNSISQVLGIGTTFDVLMKCAYINSLKGVKEVCDLFIKLISKVFDSIGDIFTQLINIVNWIIDSTKNSVDNLQLMIENPKEINLDE